MLFSSSKIGFFPPRDSSYTTGHCWQFNLGWQDEVHTTPGSLNQTGFVASYFHGEGKGADKQNRSLQCFLFLPILSVCIYWCIRVILQNSGVTNSFFKNRNSLSVGCA